MLLHRYFGSHVFETLKDRKLKTSRLSDFNDPFEFMYVYKSSMTHAQAKKYILARCNDPEFLAWAKRQLPNVSEAEIREHLRTFTPERVADLAANFGKGCEITFERRREIIDQELRAVCFTNAAKVDMLDEILLWSHYANKHKGMRIGFEFPEPLNAAFQLSEMSYQKNRVEVEFSFEVQIGVLEAALYRSAATKSSAWQYEAEVRIFAKVKDCEPHEIEEANSTVVEHFLALDPKWVKSVDFGALCSNDEIQKVAELAKADYPHVVCRKADFHQIEYALTYREI